MTDMADTGEMPEIIELPARSDDAPAGRPAAAASRGLGSAVRDVATGMVAVGVKELRGRMRGRRAFVILTVYLLLLGGFAWMIELMQERAHSGSTNFATASADVGQSIFVALLFFETLLVLFLAPAFTAGAISLEREKQTLDLLVTTPISSLAIILGKLLSALFFLFLLVVASIPLTAMVFVFGGVAPDDLVRGYVVLLITALGLGSVGLFCSTLVRRTQAATIITYFTVLAMTLGALFVWVFWSIMGGFGGGVRDADGNFVPRRPPEALLYFNPFIAMADVMCGTENGYGTWCGLVGTVTNRDLFATQPQVQVGVARPAPIAGGGVPPDGKIIEEDARVLDVAPEPFAPVRDTYWPKSSAAWLALSAVLILLSVQLVTPTRRWRPRLPWRARPTSGRAS